MVIDIFGFFKYWRRLGRLNYKILAGMATVLAWGGARNYQI